MDAPQPDAKWLLSITAEQRGDDHTPRLRQHGGNGPSGRPVGGLENGFLTRATGRSAEGQRGCRAQAHTH